MTPEWREHRLPAMLIAGMLGGVAQALPLGVVASCCCTPWSFIAALGAVLIVVRRTRARVDPGTGGVIGLGVGAIAGTLAGVIGAVRQLVLGGDGLVAIFLRDRHDVLGQEGALAVAGAVAILAAHLVSGIVLGPAGGWLGSAVIRPPTHADH